MNCMFSGPSHCKFVWTSFEKNHVLGLAKVDDIDTEEDCKARCEVTVVCWSLDFNHQEKSCWFGSKKNPTPLVPDEIVTHWNVDRDCGG